MLLYILFTYLFLLTKTVNVPNFKFKSTIFVNSTDKGFDECRFFKVKNNNLYRMGESNIISKYDVYNSSYYLQQKKFYSIDWSPNVTNLGLSWFTDEITAPYYNSTKFDLINASDLSVIRTQPQYDNTSLLKGIVTTTNYFYMLYGSRTNSSNNTMEIFSKKMSDKGGYVSLVTCQPNITISRDNKNIIVWTNTSDIDVGAQSGTSINFFYRNTNSQYKRNHTLNDVQFSLDGRYAVFQFDNKYPLTVLDLNSQSVVKTKNFSTIINQVLFLDSGTLLGVCLNYSHMEIYDIATFTLQKTVLLNTISNYSAIHFESQTLYECLQGNITAIQMTCPALTFYNLTTFSCDGCNLPQNCTQCDATTGECTSCSGNLTLVNGTCVYVQIIPIIIIKNQTNHSSPIKKNFQFGFLEGVASQISNNSGIISAIILGIQMSPFSMVFVQFISFWNICCLYSIINLQNSISLPMILEQIYNLIQISLFQFLGMNINFSVLTKKNVSTQYPSFYQVQYDVIGYNFQNVIMVGCLVIVIIIAKMLKNLVFNNLKFIREILQFSITQAIIGQIVTFIPMSILPFKAFIGSSSNIYSNQKLNSILFIFLVFSFIFAPFYLLIHYHNKQLKLGRKLKKLKTLLNQKKKGIMKMTNFEQQKNKQESNSIRKNSLLSAEAQYKFLNSFINFLAPMMILLPYQEPFFVISMIVYGYQVHVATRLSHYKIISIILSSIFLHFHILYLICYLTNDYQIIFQFATLICFGLFILGGLIELLTVFGICLYETVIYLKKFCKMPKISYPNQNKKSNVSKNKNKNSFSKKKGRVLFRIVDFHTQQSHQVIRRDSPLKQQKKMQVTQISRIRKKIQTKYVKNQQYQTPRFKPLQLIRSKNQFKTKTDISMLKRNHHKNIIQHRASFDKTQKKRYILKVFQKNTQKTKQDDQTFDYIYCHKI